MSSKVTPKPVSVTGKEVDMTCKRFRKDLAAWVGGYLNPQQAEQMKQHHTACAQKHPQGNCADLYARELAVHQALSNTEPQILPSHIEHQILDKVRNLSPVRSKYTRGWKRLQIVEISCAMLLSIGLGFVASGHLWGRDEETSVSVSDYLQMESSGLTDLYTENGETQ